LSCQKGGKLDEKSINKVDAIFSILFGQNEDSGWRFHVHHRASFFLAILNFLNFERFILIVTSL
jgi:hypothetical protein